MTISVVVLTKNEEENIEACLKALKWVDEIIVIDDESTDNTVKIAKENGAKVFFHPLNQDFAAQRNFGLEKAKGEWILFVDADERVSSALAAEISKIPPAGGQISNPNGFYLKRKDSLFGRWLNHGETGSIKLLRLAKKDDGEWVRPVHEIWQVKGETGELNEPLLHYPHQNISEFLEEINFYSTIRARELYNQERKTSLLEILAYPLAKFFQNYFLKLGVLDGMPGFLVALLMSFHSFLVRSKLYLLWRQEGGWK